MSVHQAAKILDLLEYFARTQKPATLAQLSQDLGWPRSSTFSLLQALAERGFEAVSRDYRWDAVGERFRAEILSSIAAAPRALAAE